MTHLLFLFQDEFSHQLSHQLLTPSPAKMHTRTPRMDFGVDRLPAHSAVIDQLVGELLQKMHTESTYGLQQGVLRSGCKLPEYSFLD